MLIFIRRNIFNSLGGQTLQDYVMDVIESVFDEYDQNHQGIDIKEVTHGIISVITKNEETIKKYGIKKYYNNEIDVEDFVSGYYYRTGAIVICPFDWSMDGDEDETFDYSFTLARLI